MSITKINRFGKYYKNAAVVDKINLEIVHGEFFLVLCQRCSEYRR